MKKVRVKIAVAIDSNGKYCARGWTRGPANDDDDMTGAARDDLHSYWTEDFKCESLVWVEADIPVPEPTTIEGKVTP